MNDTKYRTLCKGIRHIKIALWLIFAGIIANLFIGCGGSQSTAPGSTHLVSKEDLIARAEDLQRRQQLESWPADVEIKTTDKHESLLDDVIYMIQRLPYIGGETDMVNWGVEDYWETTTEVFQKMKCDCEGRANLAMVALNLSGILDYWNAEAKVRILNYGPDIDGHAVCTVISDDGQIVEISNSWVYSWMDESGVEVFAFGLDTIFVD